MLHLYRGGGSMSLIINPQFQGEFRGFRFQNLNFR